jgi:hypothetical protein
MARKGKATDEIIGFLREAEVRLAQGETAGKICTDRRSIFGRQECARVARPIGGKTLFIEPGSPWENGYYESFNSKLRDELLAGEQFSAPRGEGDHQAMAAANNVLHPRLGRDERPERRLGRECGPDWCFGRTRAPPPA